MVLFEHRVRLCSGHFRSIFFFLVIKKPWCVAYFNLVDKIVDKSLYVAEKMKKHNR